MSLPVTPRKAMLAHQYLYYVLGRPVISDIEYDQFCKQHGLSGHGGSDSAASYPQEIKDLAAALLAGTGEK